ncbi:tetratricopeptide repeat protein [Motiliproteus sp.]|uniref:tetratricopeptide repeat protein n=1 Tax=Motiliproteus sp. TaxID=1898955 RepID=UPI003BAB70C9
MIEGLEKLLAKGTDSAELRFGLGSAYLKQNQLQQAIEHLTRCVEQKPDYSAGWKLLGKAYFKAEQPQQAMDSYQQGIRVAEAQGDVQAVKEMQVFLKRLQR